jgi:hypothetical protein
MTRRWIFPLLILFVASLARAGSGLRCQDLFNETPRQQAAWTAQAEGHETTAKYLEYALETALEQTPLSRTPAPMTEGSSEVYKVTLGVDLYGIFKPSFKFWKLRLIHPWHDQRAPQRDVAAYRLDRALGANMIPVTVLRTIRGMEGSLQAFVDMDKKPAMKENPRNENRLKILDYILGTWDRTPANKPRADGGLVAIDNSMSFLTKGPHSSHGIAPPPSLDRIQKLLSADPTLLPSFRALSAKDVESLVGDLLTPQEIAACVQRLAFLGLLK